MRSLWKGSISFGLVNIPIRMYTANHDREFKFSLLHKKDLSQIRYARICETEEKEVPWEDIVKGFEYQPGKFIVLDEDDFKKANLAKTETIEIVDFANEDEIDSIYYSKSYFLEPDKNAQRAYALLRAALQKSKKVGIAKFVLHNREHIGVIKSYENIIILNQLRYIEEIASANDLKIPEKEKVSQKELDVALKLIEQLTTKFNPNSYKDTYSNEIKQIITKKAKGKKITPQKVEGKKPTKIHDIMELLTASLETKQKPKKAKKRA